MRKTWSFRILRSYLGYGLAVGAQNLASFVIAYLRIGFQKAPNRFMPLFYLWRWRNRSLRWLIESSPPLRPCPSDSIQALKRALSEY